MTGKYAEDPVGNLVVGEVYEVSLSAPGVLGKLKGAFLGYEEWRMNGESLDTGFYHFDFGFIDSELKGYTIRKIRGYAN